ncbi:hypothetical protein GBA65_11100 [Rubrobacter marinus]|uniref:Uncharacterized protein n=1 Tax=Rubrobacter marinus TaxID=2653852 RepID=A0A6G8PXT0_9ACTN|nr:hypothetical protein [Rubrobacter marinus]QIN78978.1 hypothetical protein GBA65_11100 [Rubrobacter marinus]
MAGWGKLIAGAVIGAAGAIYATNEELRKGLPGAARDLPETVRRRFQAATAAAREASALRRAEIIKELEAHGGDHAGRRSLGAPAGAVPGLPAAEGPSEVPAAPRVVRRAEAGRPEPAAPVEE